MYLFPKFEVTKLLANNPVVIGLEDELYAHGFVAVSQDVHSPGKLKQFIRDLHSGKLHREFHYGPDPVTESTENSHNHIGVDQGGKAPTQPPESTFKKLAPSKNRYTLLDKDEL